MKNWKHLNDREEDVPERAEVIQYLDFPPSIRGRFF